MTKILNLITNMMLKVNMTVSLLIITPKNYDTKSDTIMINYLVKNLIIKL